MWDDLLEDDDVHCDICGEEYPIMVISMAGGDWGYRVCGSDDCEAEAERLLDAGTDLPIGKMRREV